MVRIVDIAREAGVSPSTVTAALNPKSTGNTRVSAATGRKVRQIARALGYRPVLAARQLRGAKSGMVGVIYNSLFEALNQQRLSVLEKRARAAGLRLVIAQVEDDVGEARAYIDDFESRGVEGVVVLDHEMPSDRRAIPRALRRLSNVVYVNPPRGIGGPAVRVDYVDATRQAVVHVHERGRRRIAMAIADDLFLIGQERKRGFVRACEGLSVPWCPRRLWIGSREPSWQADWPDHVPQEILDRIIKDVVVAQHADALLASNDLWAVRLCQAMTKRGIRVPEDVALVGFNNADISWVCRPPLTTLEISGNRLADAIIGLLMAGNSHEDGSRPPVLPIRAELVVREST